MNKVEQTQNQKIRRDALYYVAVLLTEIYLQLSCYQYYIKDLEEKIDQYQWCFLFFSLFVVIFLLLTRQPGFKNQKEREISLRRFCSYEQLFLVYVFFWYVFSCALRQYTAGGEHFKNNDLWMFITGEIAFLLFPLAQYTGGRDTKRILETLIHTVVIPFGFFSAWLLWQVFHNNPVVFPSGQQMILENSCILQLTNVNHNNLARQAMVMLGFSLYMIITQKPALKLIYSLDFAVFFIYLILTNSRTSWYLSSAMLVCTVFILIWNGFDKRKMAIRISAGLLAALLIGFSCHWLRGEVFVLLDKALMQQTAIETAADITAATSGSSYTLKLLGHWNENGKTQQKQSLSTITISGYKDDSAASNARTYDDNLTTIGNRLPLYRASYYAMFHGGGYRFLFGVTPSDVVETLRMVSGVNKTYNFVNAHNFFLQMGVSYGVPTMIATIIFAVSLLVRSIRIMFINRKKVFPGAWMICLIVLYILANDMMEASLNSSLDIYCTVFYLLAGWLVDIDIHSRPKSESRKMEPVELEV